MRVLITGAAGLIGRHLTKGLEGEHELCLGDVHPFDGDSRFVPCDVTQFAQLQSAMQEVDAVVHLAIASGHEGEFEDDAFNQQRFDVNVKGTWNTLEAAHRAGVRRLVFTSSLMVVWGYHPPNWVASDAPAHPIGTYAQTKQLGEILCEDAARSHGLSVICLRIARPIDLEDTARKLRPIRPQWIAFPDLIEAYRLALAATARARFEIVTIVGESSRRRWDLSKAERILGFQPRFRLEDLGYVLGDETAADTP